MTTTAQHDDHSAPGGLEAALGSHADPDPAAWKRLRTDLGDRAAAEGLLDVAFEHHDSPLGPILISATGEGLVRIGLPAEDEDEVLEDLARRVSVRVLRAPRESVARARRQLDEYFGGRRQVFDVPLDWQLIRGFRRDVLQATAAIPFGQTKSYREVARQAGSPAAVRAAGTALARNPLPIVVPCHRVLRTGGQLGAYRGGPEAKAQLLRLEGRRDDG